MNGEQWGLGAATGAIALLIGLVVTNASKFRERQLARWTITAAIFAFGLAAVSALVNQFWSGQLTGYFEIGHETTPIGELLLAFPGQEWPVWMMVATALSLPGLFALTRSKQ
jgi:hypothetical protein